jgi:hypothetical protein
MFDGYGIELPPPASGIEIPPALVNVLPTCDVGKFTVWTMLPLLVAKVAFPTYVAWIVCRRSERVFAGTAHCACPLPFTGTFAHSVTLVVLSTKFTTPVFTVLMLVVVEVNVTAWFVFDGFKDDEIVVVVADAAVVTISSDHPPAIVAPVPPEPVSSATKMDQVPLTLAPLNPPNTDVNVAAPAVAAL